MHITAPTSAACIHPTPSPAPILQQSSTFTAETANTVAASLAALPIPHATIAMLYNVASDAAEAPTPTPHSPYLLAVTAAEAAAAAAIHLYNNFSLEIPATTAAKAAAIHLPL